LEYVATGSATAAVVSNGGTMTVTTGGTTNGATISAGGTLIDFGTVSGTVLDSGGGAYISAGGVAVGTTVRGGAADIVQFGGTASGTIVGGVEAVFGTTVGARVASGGLEYVAAGGLASAVVISGGTLEVASGGSTGASAVTFAAGGGGILQLDNAQAFNGKVSGFGVLDYLDLRDIAFGSNTTLGFTEAAGNTSGTLRVSDGSRTANITLLGQYVTGQLGMGSDGAGGTFIAAPQVVAQAEPNANGLVTTHQV
jgi:autotransporter passenger strand-loop-strand repeat protein